MCFGQTDSCKQPCDYDDRCPRTTESLPEDGTSRVASSDRSRQMINGVTTKGGSVSRVGVTMLESFDREVELTHANPICCPHIDVFQNHNRETQEARLATTRKEPCEAERELELGRCSIGAGVAVSPQASVIWCVRTTAWGGMFFFIAVDARTAGSLPSAALCLPRPA